MIKTVIGAVVGLAVCLALVYITRWLSEIVDAVDSVSE